MFDLTKTFDNTVRDVRSVALLVHDLLQQPGELGELGEDLRGHGLLVAGAGAGPRPVPALVRPGRDGGAAGAGAHAGAGTRLKH